jgi:hypothetical protein
LFISGIRRRLKTTGSHTSHIFSATPVNQATGLQARQGDAVLEREKESSKSLFKQICSALLIFVKYTTVIARRDIENYNHWFFPVSLEMCFARFNSY